MSQITSTSKKPTFRNPMNKFCRITRKIFGLLPEDKGNYLNDRKDSYNFSFFPVGFVFVIGCILAAALLILCFFW